MARPSRGTLAELRPDIAEQLVDKSLADKLSVGSNSSVEWECEHGHRWFAKVFNRTNSKRPSGCPICNGKQVLVGYNDLATTDPEIAKLCADPEDAKQYTRSSNKKITWRCEHGHTWEAPVSRVANGKGGCPVCSGRIPEVGVNDLATTHPEIAAQLEDLSLATKLKAGSNKKVKWVCPNNPNHVWEATPYSRTTKKTGCPYCSGRFADQGATDLATTHPELAKELVHPEDAHKYSAGSMVSVEWRCKDHPDHIWTAMICNRTLVHSGCPYCAGKKVKEGFNDLATTRPDLVARLVDPSIAKLVTQGSGREVEWKCDENPEHTWTASIYDEARKTITHCPICGHVHRSYEEQDLEKVVRTLLDLDVEVRISDRSVLSDRELDIYIPSKNFAIEFNGVYWHSEAKGKDNKYHQRKYIDCQERGVQLLQIWEDDWWDRRDVCIKSIAAKLGVSDRLPLVLTDINPQSCKHVGARETMPVEISTDEAVSFLSANHIQGFASGKYYYGLKDKDGVLRAVMSLRSPNQSARSGRNVGDWEIIRYATFGTVSGGFSKLLQFAEESLKAKHEVLNRWISFSANCVSNGSMYEKAGFVRLGLVPPDYAYVGEFTDWRRVGKANFRKSRFEKDPNLKFEKDWTEHKAALANNLYRIYDAGKVKWAKEV